MNHNKYARKSNILMLLKILLPLVTISLTGFIFYRLAGFELAVVVCVALLVLSIIFVVIPINERLQDIENQRIATIEEFEKRRKR